MIGRSPLAPGSVTVLHTCAMMGSLELARVGTATGTRVGARESCELTEHDEEHQEDIVAITGAVS